MKIAVLYTCFNRREKTISSLRGLFSSQQYYDSRSSNKIVLSVFLTDDGCTDGTADAIRETYPSKNITILMGDGNLYWAGGMRNSWNAALKLHEEWDFYLLLNDDTVLQDIAFEELLNTHVYCLNKYHKEGIYSGITCAHDDPNHITYGGDVILNKFTGKRKRLSISDTPQMCDFTNANIMLVPKSIVDAIGILYSGYKHSAADFDYTYKARSLGYPVLVTANACGCCDFDHESQELIKKKILSMPLCERRKFFSNPLYSGLDHLTLVKRTTPLKYPVALLFRYLKIYCPQMYYWINRRR